MTVIRFSLRVDEELWDSFLHTIPRPEYPSVNHALNQIIAERVVEVLGENHERKDPL